MKIIVLVALCGLAVPVITLVVPEMSTWDENRFIQCVHCMDYDRHHISIFGCKPRRPILCNGNACFMRFHKEIARPSVMFTSGCVNLTKEEMETIATTQKNSEEAGNPNGTLLCELAENSDTCICSNMDKCNFINLSPDFSEYNRTPLLKSLIINPVNHMKMFLPHEYRRLNSYKVSRENYSNRILHYLFLIFFSFCQIFRFCHF